MYLRLFFFLSRLNSVDELDHDHSHIDGVFHQHSTMRSLILLMALSFHSVFEGLAIGLQQSLSQLMSLFLAVIAHKGMLIVDRELAKPVL